LRAGCGRNDAILLCLAMTGAEPVCALDEVAAALAGSAERLEETRAQGAAFEATLAAMGPGASVGAGGARRAYPVAVGLAARRLDLAPALVARLFVHGFAANLVSAAVRFVPLGQAEGQRVLAGLHRTVGTVADAAARAGIEDLGGAAAGADLAAMAHESLEVRIFRT